MGKSKQLCFFNGESVITDEYDTMGTCLKYFQGGEDKIYESEFKELMIKWLADDKSMKNVKLVYSLA